MLEQVSAVEVLQPELVGREVRRHPVEDHADPVLVQVIDQIHEVLRRAVAAGGGEVPGHLVAPRAVEGMLHHRHELDMRETEPAHVLREARRQLSVGEPAVVVVRHPHPRAQVKLVNGPGRLAGLNLRPVRHPRLVLPVVREVPDHRRLARRWFGERRKWIRLVRVRARDPRVEVELVHRAMVGAADEAFPDARRLARLQRAGAWVPVVEVADHAHLVGVWRPDGEERAVLHQVRPQLFVQVAVRALVEEVEVERRQQRGANHPGATRSRIPRSGMRTQSGLLLSS